MKSQVMKLAWKIFRNEKNQAKGITWSVALKTAWATVKRMSMQADYYFFASSNTKFQGVKKWFAEKEFKGRGKKDLACMSVTAVKVNGIVAETSKAVQLEIVTPYGVSTKWYPKSVIA